MINLLNIEYDKIKIYIKYNKNRIYDEKIQNEIISFYSNVLGYYSAKMDLKVNVDGIERLKDKIMLQSFDKKLVEKLKLFDYMDNFINIDSESKRGEFYNSIDFLELKSHLNKDALKKIKDEFDNAYLMTVLNIRQNKLNKKNQNKIYKAHEKNYKLIKNL